MGPDALSSILFKEIFVKIIDFIYFMHSTMFLILGFIFIQ